MTTKMRPIDAKVSRSYLTEQPVSFDWLRHCRAEQICRAGLMLLLLTLVPGCKPSKEQILLEPSQVLGKVLAEETVRVTGANKRVVLIVRAGPAAGESPTEEALRSALKKSGITIVTVKADVGNPMMMNGQGLTATDFFGAMDKSAGAGAVISLVGAPLLTPGDVARLGSEHPPIMVVATSMLGNRIGVRNNPDLLAQLLQSKTIQLAIIDGPDPATQATGANDSAQETFAQNYHILRPAM